MSTAPAIDRPAVTVRRHDTVPGVFTVLRDGQWIGALRDHGAAGWTATTYAPGAHGVDGYAGALVHVVARGVTAAEFRTQG